MHTILETERLRLRAFTLNDADFILDLLNSPGWLQFIGDRNVRTTEQAKAYLENGPMKSFREYGHGLSLVEIKSDKQPIGMCGILHRSYLEQPDIGFALLPDFQGQGYAGEIVAATLQQAKTHWNIPDVSAIVLENNTRSVRLLEKLGFSFTKRICLPDSGEELLLYNNQQ